MSRQIVCLASDIAEATDGVKNASNEILASRNQPEEASECILLALTHLFNTQQLLENAEQIQDARPPAVPLGSAVTPAAAAPRGFDWSDEIGVMLGRSFGEAMRMVTNELSTILAAGRSSANDDVTETWAALEQLRTRCGVAATWAEQSEREECTPRESEMRVRAAAPSAGAG